MVLIIINDSICQLFYFPWSPLVPDNAGVSVNFSSTHPKPRLIQTYSPAPDEVCSYCDSWHNIRQIRSNCRRLKQRTIEMWGLGVGEHVASAKAACSVCARKFYRSLPRSVNAIPIGII